jgi:hypothetical protein
VGTALASVGVTADITWYVYTDSTKGQFWSWIGITGTSCIAVGAAMLAIGFFMQSDKETGTPELSTVEGEEPKVHQERIGYRLSGRAKARPHNAHISDQDVAFDVTDDADLADENSRIE